MASSCCNSSNISGHNWDCQKKRKNFDLFNHKQMCEKVLQISSTAMVCDTCRKRLSEKTPVLPTTESNDSRTSESEESEVFVQNDEAITSLNIGRYS